jgi:hypothetical protein
MLCPDSLLTGNFAGKIAAARAPLGASRAGGFAHIQGMIQAIKQKLT